MPAYELMYTPRQVVVKQTGLLTQQDKRLGSDRLTQAAASAESVRKPESTLNKWEIRETLDYAITTSLSPNFKDRSGWCFAHSIILCIAF